MSLTKYHDYISLSAVLQLNSLRQDKNHCVILVKPCLGAAKM